MLVWTKTHFDIESTAIKILRHMEKYFGILPILGRRFIKFFYLCEYQKRAHRDAIMHI